jgi:Undecaprenyl-phosphate galactose phosphotransferase WbaP
MRLTYLMSDLIGIGIGLGFSTVAIASTLGVWPVLTSALTFRLHMMLAAGLVFVAANVRTYSAVPPRPVRQFRGWVLGSFTACAALIAGSWLLGVGSLVTYAALALGTMISILLASFFRAVCRITFGRSSWWGTRLIVVGKSGLSAKAFGELKREPQWGLRPVGFVDDANESSNGDSADCLGAVAQLDDLADKLNVDWGLLAVHSFDADEMAELLARAPGRIKHWIILPPLEQFPGMWLEACEAARRPAMTITNRLRESWSAPLKRAFDLALAITLGLAALPLIGLIVLGIRLGSPGPALYGHERIGRCGRRFKLWKFRTMLPEADAVLARYLESHPQMAEEWSANRKLRSDPRVTWFGHWLRSTSLDELPQVWNVIVGDMSLVGPRPIAAHEIDKYAEHYGHYVQMLPGITGLWQVSGRSNTTYEERVALDVYYVQNWSLWLDVYILACTAKVVLLCEGAY